MSCLFCMHLIAFAQGPNETGTYYQTADGKKAEELKSALFAIISPHTIQSYTPGVWNAINSYDLREDGKIWDIYSGICQTLHLKRIRIKVGIWTKAQRYNREHAMPKSWFNEPKTLSIMIPMYILCIQTCIICSQLMLISTQCVQIILMARLARYQSVKGGFSKFGRCVDSLGYKVYGTEWWCF